MQSRPIAFLTAVGLFGACAPESPAPVLHAHEIDTPAGPDSGEPHLAAVGQDVYMSWLERAEAGGHHLLLSRYAGGRWGEPQVVATSDRFFVNWADAPSVAVGPEGALWAHWLERSGPEGYDYGIRLARSDDAGRTWSAAWTPHQDASPTEHGFVSNLPVDSEMGWVWLDGRGMAAGPGGEPATGETALYFRAYGASGPTGPESVLDARVCDCCQTDAAHTAAGPIVVYRDRDEREVRDVQVIRWVDGTWSEATPVHEDHWQTGACPVNGPAVAARGERVAVAWFTAADGVPRVNVAFSANSAETFGAPTSVDSGDPSGRVDVLMLADGTALVSWLERTGGDFAEVQVRHVTPSGRTSEALRVSTGISERAGGYPRMAQTAAGEVLVAWTDVSSAAATVRVAAVDVQVAP